MNTQEIVDELRRRGAETPRIEVKAGTGGLPKSLPESISAFCNGSGGTILIGLDDGTFEPVSIQAESIRDALAGMAAEKMQPPVRGDIEIDIVDGLHPVVRFDVPEAPLGDKPCFVQAKGRYGGSYIRGGDGDRKLSQYEIDRLVENTSQPMHDREIVPEASFADLDRELLDPYLERMRATRPRAFAPLGRDDMLRNLGVAGASDDELRPTLAGLLVFGRYPQQYFPQLFVSVVVVPGASMGELGSNNERFLDNRSFEGPLPHMAADAIAAVTRHLTRTSVMHEGQRVERLEYPLEVVRELIVNALMHRDYSPMSRGAQIQVELYADRLVVRSPGGFYGMVQAEDLGAPDVSSSRNAVIAKLLADTSLPGTGHMVAENRGSGIPTVLRALNKAGMAPPHFAADLRRVEVTVPHHALLDTDTLSWIEGLAQPDLSPAQVQALAVIRHFGVARNQTLQGWGIHPADATRELTNLVIRGLVVKEGDRRGASYRLARADVHAAAHITPHAGGRAGVEESSPAPDALTDRQRRLLTLFEGAPLTASAITEGLKVSYGTAMKEINALLQLGYVEATAPARSRNRAYVRAPDARRMH